MIHEYLSLGSMQIRPREMGMPPLTQRHSLAISFSRGIEAGRFSSCGLPRQRN